MRSLMGAPAQTPALEESATAKKVHAPTLADACSLASDAAQLRLTDELYAVLKAAATNSRAATESKNIIERWLLSMVNMGKGSGIYHHTELGDEINQQLRTEIVEKRIAHPSGASALVQRMLDLVDKELAISRSAANEEICCDDDMISYSCELVCDSGDANTSAANAGAANASAANAGAANAGAANTSAANAGAANTSTPTQFTFTHMVDTATTTLLKIGGCTATVRAALRYAALLSGGQQWGIPRAHVAFLYDRAGVRNEAFASPFNSRLIGLPDASFCSLFTDTDGVFGSKGDFFALDLATAPAGNWVVNPPFVNELMARAARKCLAAVETGPAHFYFIMPAWRDCEAYLLLRKSKFVYAELALEPGSYYYESPTGERIRTRAASIYFAIAPTGPSAVEAKRRADFSAILEHYRMLPDE
jgi:hypothetical protein